MTLEELATAAGRAGEGWMTFTARDDVQALVDATPDFDTGPIEVAFAAGRRLHRTTNKGWLTYWTTAPADFDWFGTETVEICGVWYGKPLRKIIADPHYARGQVDRYGSGLHPAFEEDPRVAAAAAQARLERDLAEDAARAARRTAGLARLAQMTDGELDALDDDQDPRETGVGWSDVRAERTRRDEACATARREAAWERCCALVPRGAILVDDGSPNVRGFYGVIKGRDPHVWYGISFRDDYDRDVDRATVVGEGNEIVGSLERVAADLEAGRLRVAAAEDVPPRPVLVRFGQEQRNSIVRVLVDGTPMWVGCQRFSYTPIVLDARGHLVRSRQIREGALQIAHTK